MAANRKQQELKALRRRAALLDRTIELLEKLEGELSNEPPAEFALEANGTLRLEARNVPAAARLEAASSRRGRGELLAFPPRRL